LKRKARFVNTTNIADEGIVHKIHVNFRLMFLKDTAAARWIEEGTILMLMNVFIYITIIYRQLLPIVKKY
jgi:hypothetical protein